MGGSILSFNKKTKKNNPICSRCGRDEETTEHALRDCKWMKFFSRASPLRLAPSLGADQNPTPISTWLESIFHVNSDMYHFLFASLIWVIWFARNLLMFQEKTLSHAECYEIEMNSIFQKIHAPNRGQIARRFTTVCEVGQRKWNCDAAMIADEGVGIEMVILNETNHVVVSYQRFLQGKRALAMRELIRQVEEHNPESIISESYCQTLISKLRNPTLDLTYMGNILEEIREQASNCRGITFSWTPREGNSIAHELAKNACHSRRDCTFAGALPVCPNAS